MPREPGDAYVLLTRRALIVQALWCHGDSEGGGLSMAALNALLKARGWPEAQWVGARNEPYYTGTRQHLWGLSGDDVLAYDQDRDDLGFTFKRESREQAPQALRLKRLGRSDTQIAAGLGVHVLEARRLLTDPLNLVGLHSKWGTCFCGNERLVTNVHCSKCASEFRHAALESAAERRQAAQELLPSAEFAERIQPRLVMPVSFGVEDDLTCVLIVHTERGAARVPVEGSWEDALRDSGALRA